MTLGLPATLVILAVHGSPGFPDDFEPFLSDPVFKNSKVVKLRAEEAVVQRALIENKANSVLLIGYSWGAYLVLKTLHKHPELRPQQTLLVAPFLEASQPLTGLTLALAKTPVLSDLIVYLSKTKWKNDFLARMFADPSQDSLKNYIERLHSTATWKAMLTRKILQQEEPLMPTPNLAVTVLFAEHDRIVNRVKTEELLHRLQISFSAKQITNAEHGFLITPTPELLKAVLELAKGMNK